ncbi:MAG TPA: alpha/beta hydrolase [Candidatus Limnocylindrales bacterium]|nr:alpha/beta hydrolase [Candidatus Limnocylindrales bacterium]
MSGAPRRRVTVRRIVAALVAVVVVVAIAGAVWLAIPQQVLPEADAALIPSASVAVEQDDGNITFVPTGGADVGLILYPGGKVPAKAYAPTARLIADRGYLVVVVSMPFNFAVLDVDAASRVIAARPEIQTWAVGGHSLGGAMAGQYVAAHPDAVEGLVLWAAYSAADVSRTGVAAAVVYGTLDTGAARFVSPDSLALLPANQTITAIDGGNHANFGAYAGQPNDPPATIPREQQQQEAADSTVELLERVEAAR